MSMRSRFAETVEILLPLLIAVGVAWWALRASGYWLVDDSFISFRYATNLAKGAGLTWNPGTPVEGYTNLLWVLLLTPFAYFDIDLILPAAALGLLFQLLTLVLMGHITRRCFPHATPWLRVVAPLLLATNLHWAFWTVSGMESASFAFWVLLSVHLALRGRETKTRSWALSISLVAAYLTRPEGAMVAALVMGWEFASAWWVGGKGARLAFMRQRFRQLWLPVTLLALVVAGHIALRLWYYGFLLPNTFYAKVIPGGAAFWRGLSHVQFFLFGAAGVLVLPGLLPLWSMCRRSRGHLARGHLAQSPLAKGYLAQGYLLLFVYLIYVSIIGGDLPGWARFYLPLVPLPLVAMSGLLVAGNAWLKRWPGRAQATMALSVVGILAGQQLISAPAALANMHVVRVVRDRNVGLREFFFRAHVPPDALLAIDAVGAFGYYLPNRIIDTWGLNDTVIAHRRLRSRAKGRFAHEKDDWHYVLHQHPDFIIESVHVPPLRGYDACWPNALVRPVQIRRRNYPLKEAQRGLGMPPGSLRTLKLPPPCVHPYVGLDQLRRFSSTGSWRSHSSQGRPQGRHRGPHDNR
ncbi:MAG: hypothetical protein JRH20_05570 [Deltaproteobacteria bacterium]|nr:hypothetical protein [Deltaproteobacteria bacterium]